MALMVHFKLDESSGTTATDSSGNGRDGTLKDFTNTTNCWVGTGSEGKRNGGLDFGQGTDDTCDFPFPDPGDLTTLMAFLRWDSDAGTYPRVFHLGRGDAAPHQMLYLSPGNKSFGLSLTFGGGAQTFHTDTSTIDYDGAWRHLAVTYDASDYSNNPIFYINGKVSPTIVSARSSGDRTELTVAFGSLGQVYDVDNRGLDGVLSDARIYNHILTAHEIDQIANFRPYETAEALDLKADFTIDRYKELSKQYATRGGMDNNSSLQAPFSIGARGAPNIRNRSKVYQVESG